jgi:hypothetical protein
VVGEEGEEDGEGVEAEEELQGWDQAPLKTRVSISAHTKHLMSFWQCVQQKPFCACRWEYHRHPASRTAPSIPRGCRNARESRQLVEPCMQSCKRTPARLLLLLCMQEVELPPHPDISAKDELHAVTTTGGKINQCLVIPCMIQERVTCDRMLPAGVCREVKTGHVQVSICVGTAQGGER